MQFSEDVIRLNPELRSVGRKRVALKTGDAKRAGGRLIVNGRQMDSALEERVWLEWIPIWRPLKATYKPFVLHLAGGNYTPDFVLFFAHETWIIEAKGSWNAYQSGRSSKRALKQASIEFAMLGRFFVLMPDDARVLRLAEVVQGRIMPPEEI